MFIYWTVREVDVYKTNKNEIYTEQILHKYVIHTRYSLMKTHHTKILNRISIYGQGKFEDTKGVKE